MENKEKERAILTVGRPDLEQLSRDEQQVFYSTLLVCMMAFNRHPGKFSPVRFGNNVSKTLQK